jgi:hypothetical protein
VIVHSNKEFTDTAWVIIVLPLISDFPSAAECSTNKATISFLVKIEKGEEDGAEDMVLLACPLRKRRTFCDPMTIQVCPLTR